jgi:hypothetical protein
VGLMLDRLFGDHTYTIYNNNIYIYMYICIWYTYIVIYIYTHCVYIYICICIYICIYIYVYIRITKAADNIFKPAWFWNFVLQVTPWVWVLKRSGGRWSLAIPLCPSTRGLATGQVLGAVTWAWLAWLSGQKSGKILQICWEEIL